MGEIRRAADGRRLFSAAFKREQIERVVRGEMTLAGLSRELDVSPSVVVLCSPKPDPGRLALRRGRFGPSKGPRRGARRDGCGGASSVRSRS